MRRGDERSQQPRAINVDVSALDRFAGSVDSEVEANFRPEAAQLMTVYGQGAHFGHGHPSADVTAARVKYTECLQGAAEQLAGYVNAAKILVDAAHMVSSRYRDTDALAVANAVEVEQALWAAMRAASHAQRDATAGQGEPPVYVEPGVAQ
jgi:hypothetical protein